MSKKEKVIFLENVKGIAQKGEVKEVAEALARNFLIPKQKALIYNETIARQIEIQAAKAKKEKVLKTENESKIFALIDQKKLVFSLREKNKTIFGSVGIVDLIKRLKEELGIELNKKNFPNFKSLDKKGEFSVEVRVNKDLMAHLFIKVESH